MEPPVAYPAVSPAPRLGTIDLLLASAVQELAEITEAPGVAACVVVGGQVVASYATGLADTRSLAAMTSTTTFDMASQTKLMTAVAMVALAERGTLALDDPITNHLESRLFRADERLAQISILDLLLHRAGFTHATRRNFARPLHTSGLSTMRRRSASVPVSHDGPIAIDYTPRTSSQYSNVGAALAAEIVARNFGSTYREAVERLVLHPLSMADTHLYGRARPGGRRHRRAQRLLPLELHPRWIGIAGGISTVGDLARLISPYTGVPDALSLVPVASLQEWSSHSLLGGEAVGHVVGWRLEQQPHGVILHQAGTRPGLSVKAMVAPADRIGCVLLANKTCRLEIHGVAERLMDRLRGLERNHAGGRADLLAGSYSIAGSPLRNPTFWLDSGGRIDVHHVENATDVTFGRNGGRFPVTCRDGEYGIQRRGAWIPMRMAIDRETAHDTLALGGPYTGLILTRLP